ncbi:MAG: hypothetical protein sL5_10320 [Candidatus Mesenet longicola]|uniref:Uncharacterized protein n=1 Tax=Candidatus Mesenet longicola TaxID=1892558 RepID=A0A8J3HQ67_9RICK|nr:MAG: hypothetical protein sL5_10320 [Candidatus Mesenet longicola]
MPITPINIKISPIELDDEEDVAKKQLPDDWPDQNLIDSIQSERYLSIPKHSEKHNQLTPESGIGTDDGLPHFPHNVKEYQEEDKQSINSSVTGSEYSPKALDDIRFLQEIRNFPLSQKDDQFALKNEEDEYDIEAEKTARSCIESVLQETYSDSNDWSSQEDSSYSSDDILPEDSFLMKLEVPLTENEKNLIHEFYQKMEEVDAQNDQERKENIHNPSINCTENALKRIKRLVDEYLKRGIRLNSSYKDSTVTNLIFERIRYVLDGIVRVTYNTTAYGQFKPYDIPNYDEDYDDEYELFKGSSAEIVSSIIGDLLIKGGKVKRSYFYYDRLAHVTRSIDYGLYEKCEEIDNKLKSVAYKSVINKSKRRDDFEVAIDNGHFYIKYEKNSIVELTKVINNKIIEDLNSEYKLNLKVGILQIGSSVIRVEKLGEQRNYTDIPEGIIKMSFTAEIEGKTEKISILLHPDEEDSSKIKVELNEENQEKFDKLKDKSSLGKNCFLGGKSIIKAIQDKEFTKYESYKPTTPAITPTLLEQISVSNIFDNLKNQCTQFQKYLFGG